MLHAILLSFRSGKTEIRKDFRVCCEIYSATKYINQTKENVRPVSQCAFAAKLCKIAHY
eukprot:m.718769 g.718769  ORF g.718769 m.718769 type:complete len:59 (-) comp22997_c1_seq21:3968-4144(-)